MNFSEKQFTREDIEVMSDAEINMWFELFQYEELTKKKKEILLSKVTNIETPNLKLN